MVVTGKWVPILVLKIPPFHGDALQIYPLFAGKVEVWSKVTPFFHENGSKSFIALFPINLCSTAYNMYYL